MEAKQMSLFECTFDRFIIDRPIRLIELFAGIGAQSKALENLGADFESHRVVEWSYNSIIAYNAIHVGDFNDYSQNLTKEEVLERVRGVSIDYNKPATDAELLRRGEKWLRKLYSSMVAIKDLCPDVSRVHAEDLGITEREQYCYILTYSFPCQDLSVAGKGKGMSKGSGTRSGLLWEVERILNELKAKEQLPHVLVMENVPQVCSEKNAKDWESWLQALEMMGYTNYFDVLNAKDYGIPQNRKRCFCVSILGQYGYSFPKRIPLTHRLKDFLDEGISEKYYLKQRIIDSFLKNYVPKDDDAFVVASRGRNPDNPNDRSKGAKLTQRLEPNKEGLSNTLTTVDKDNYVCDGRIIEAGSLNYYGFRSENVVLSPKGISTTILARDSNGPKKILEAGKLPGVGYESAKKVYSQNGLSPTILAGDYKGAKKILEAIPIPTANSKGFELAIEGDGVLPTWKGAMGTVQKQSCPTIMTDGNTIGVVVRKENKDDG